MSENQTSLNLRSTHLQFASAYYALTVVLAVDVSF